MLAQNRTSQYAKPTVAKSTDGLGSLFLSTMHNRISCGFLVLACYALHFMIRRTGTPSGVLESLNQSANLVRLITSCLAALMISLFIFQRSH